MSPEPYFEPLSLCPVQPDEHLTPDEAADLLNVTAGTLKRWRWNGVGPAFVRLTPRRVMYRRSAVETWRSFAAELDAVSPVKLLPET